MNLSEQIQNTSFAALHVVGDGDYLQFFDRYANVQLQGSVINMRHAWRLSLKDMYFGESCSVVTAKPERIYEQLLELDRALVKVRDAMSDYRSLYE